ncbi:uncharacterized protein LOC105277102 [Ooceraea biroi]|uniref:uncharacterized protein LOC105277102 n=1 Tax=Ooceraea biroi TaxID=2015173 RepID=UPI00097165DD|nr:uncharacterized protein LOC105277102 [Ooceraea biroi]
MLRTIISSIRKLEPQHFLEKIYLAFCIPSRSHTVIDQPIARCCLSASHTSFAQSSRLPNAIMDVTQSHPRRASRPGFLPRFSVFFAHRGTTLRDRSQILLKSSLLWDIALPCTTRNDALLRPSAAAPLRAGGTHTEGEQKGRGASSGVKKGTK